MIANVTDIDDKILAKSAEAGVPWFAHAYRYERELHDAYAALGCVPPDLRAPGHRPRAGDDRDDQGADREAVTPTRPPTAPGDVYFDVQSWPAYGSLSRQKIDDMEPAADADPRGKRDPRDFALWKGHKPDEPLTASWVTPWGRGRPGWHLECSAMAGKYLGDEFDIHGGGLDLRFPHHENELAQSTAAGQKFARFWMHNAWVTAAGEKMSKSLGNGALVSQVTASHPPRAVRFYLAAAALPLGDRVLRHLAGRGRRRAGAHRRLRRPGHRAGGSSAARRVPDGFAAAMDDDLGTPGAVAVLYDSVRRGQHRLDRRRRRRGRDPARRGARHAGVLGLDADDVVWARRSDAARPTA